MRPRPGVVGPRVSVLGVVLYKGRVGRVKRMAGFVPVFLFSVIPPRRKRQYSLRYGRGGRDRAMKELWGAAIHDPAGLMSRGDDRESPTHQNSAHQMQASSGRLRIDGLVRYPRKMSFGGNLYLLIRPQGGRRLPRVWRSRSVQLTPCSLLRTVCAADLVRPVNRRDNRWQVRGPASVSSTHLRAPETGLDLGCRLLLEKKKNNDHNTEISTASGATHDTAL